MKNILYTLLVIITLSSIGFATYATFDTENSEDKVTVATTKADTALVANDLPDFKLSTDWNISLKENVVGLENGAWGGQYDGVQTRKITLNKDFKSIDIYMDSVGPTGVGIPSCYEGEVLVGQNYFATRYLSQDEFGPKIIFLNKNTFALKENEEFENLKSKFLETSEEDGENLTYCEKNLVDYTVASGMTNQFNNEVIDKMFIGAISSINDFENAQEMLSIVDKFTGINQTEIK